MLQPFLLQTATLCMTAEQVSSLPFAAGKFSPQFFPKLEGIQVLFAQATTAASLWVHLLSINMFAARTAYLQGALLSYSKTEQS